MEEMSGRQERWNIASSKIEVLQLIMGPGERQLPSARSWNVGIPRAVIDSIAHLQFAS